MRTTAVTNIIGVLIAIIVLPHALHAQTEPTLQGTVKQVLPQRGMGDGNGTHILLQTRNGPVEVCLGPTRFLEASYFLPQTGDSVVVRGHPVTSAEGPVFIASSLALGGRTITLRSASGKPRWSGCGHDCSRLGNCDPQRAEDHAQDGQK